MGIYTVNKQQFKKIIKNSSMGVRDSTKCRKNKRLRRKGYRKN